MAVSPLIFAVGAAMGNVAGALAVVRQEKRSLAFIETCLAFGAGFMLALVLIGVLPVVFSARDTGNPAAGLLVLLGYVVVHVAQHVITPHFHFGVETHHVGPEAGYSALVGLTLHAFFDGVAIASGFLVSWSLGVAFFLGVMLHKLPEGVTVSSIMLASGLGRRRAIGHQRSARRTARASRSLRSARPSCAGRGWRSSEADAGRGIRTVVRN